MAVRPIPPKLGGSEIQHLSNNNERHKMIKSPKEADFPLKQEGYHNSSDHEKAKASSSGTTTSSPSQWLRLKDPRIVRVSRAFGGKDRHSKVCTIRGLRDRRVRLSVPTAIQLYDLQDRLGLNQPSKVVDWLLNAAKHEIDELPPLPILPGDFTLGSYVTSNEATISHPNEQQRFHMNRSIQWDQGSIQNSKSKEVANWINRSSEEDNKQGSNEEGPHGVHVLQNNLLPKPNHHPSFLGLMNAMPLGYQFESSSDVSHQLGNHGSFTNQTDMHSISVVPFPSTLSLSSSSSGTSQILVCPTQSYLPSHVTAMDMDQRQISHYHQLLNSSGSQNLFMNSMNPPSQFHLSQTVKPFSLAMITPKLLQSPNSSENPSHKDQDFPSE